MYVVREIDVCTTLPYASRTRLKENRVRRMPKRLISVPSRYLPRYGAHIQNADFLRHDAWQPHVLKPRVYFRVKISFRWRTLVYYYQYTTPRAGSQTEKRRVLVVTFRGYSTIPNGRTSRPMADKKSDWISGQTARTRSTLVLSARGCGVLKTTTSWFVEELDEPPANVRDYHPHVLRPV